MYLKSSGPDLLSALHGVRRLLLPLERQYRNHVQLPVARKVRRIDDLIVGDGRAYIAVREPAPHCRHAVQAFTYRAIAIRMHVRFEAASATSISKALKMGAGKYTSGPRLFDGAQCG